VGLKTQNFVCCTNLNKREGKVRRNADTLENLKAENTHNIYFKEVQKHAGGLYEDRWSDIT
jgi:hypothetical protein